MRLATVILHYGDPSLTARLERQLRHSDPKADVFVLDNCAPEPYDGAWVRTPENLYWAGAFEYSLRTYAEKGYTHVWFLNNDLFFASSPPYISRASGRLKRLEKTLGKVGVYAPSVLTNPYHPQMVCDASCQYRLVSYVDGIAPMVNLDCWRALGGVDYGDNIYGYGVETWFTLSAHRAGWPVVVDHQVTIKHIYHSTARKITGFLEKAARAEAVYLTDRLGPDYRRQMNAEKNIWTDKETL